MKPFNLIIQKPNKEFALKVAKHFNDNGYASNHISYFKFKKISSRYYWNFLQIANISQLTRNFNIPKLIIEDFNNLLTEGVRIHWMRNGYQSIDRAKVNYEKHLISLVKKSSNRST